jgi:hypothetical protein
MFGTLGAQPGVEFALLLRRLDDVLLGPAADLVPPAPAVRPEALAEDAAPAAPPLPVMLAVGAGHAFIIEDDAAPGLGPFPTPGSMHRWFPVAVPESPISVPKRPPSCTNLVGAGGFEPPASRL